VIAPIEATTRPIDGDTSIIPINLAVRYTPAATIVAAWINAETGVGPSIASGNQTWNGNCADLPQAPANIRIPAMPSSHNVFLASSLSFDSVSVVATACELMACSLLSAVSP